MPSFTLTVSNAKFNEFKEAFLAHVPVPLDENEQPTMAENAWIKSVIIRKVKSVYREGRLILHRQQSKPTVDEDIIT